VQSHDIQERGSKIPADAFERAFDEIQVVKIAQVKVRH